MQRASTQEDFLRLFETVARASVAGELHRHEEAHEEAATPRSAVTATKTWTVTATTDGPPARRRFEGDVWESKEEEAARNRGNVDQDAGGMTGGSDPLDPVEARVRFNVYFGNHINTVQYCSTVVR